MTMQMPDGTIVHMSGLPNHVPLDDETAERLVKEYPDMMWCCFQSANSEGALEALTSCSCWEPIYDKEQETPNEKAPVWTRLEQCSDCAYRHDSPEFTDDRTVLDRANETGVFWCHKGMRRPKLWRHPLGAEVEGDPADYAPPIVDNIPYRADGAPANRCHGWDQHRVKSPTTWQDVRKGVDRLSDQKEEWEGIPIPLPGIPLRLREGHDMREASALFDRATNDVEIEITCGGGDIREDEFIRNVWYSKRLQCKVYVYQQGDKVFLAKEFASHDLCMERLNLWLQTLGASDAWDEDAEARAREKLRGMLTERQWRHYDLTGSFLEKSPRSQLTYMFRRLRPTVVMSPRHKPGSLTDSMLCIAVLCMHPIGYYDRSWGGCMVPSDDVIAHLSWMRGDEAGYWGQANQHQSWHPEAGL